MHFLDKHFITGVLYIIFFNSNRNFYSLAATALIITYNRIPIYTFVLKKQLKRF